MFSEHPQSTTVEAKFKSRIHAWFVDKSFVDKSQAAKSASASKPPKPCKPCKVKVIRIVDGEVFVLDGGKKGLRKLLCWK